MENTLLNLVPASYLPEVHLSQYDVGRELKFTLKDGSSDYTVPSGAVVTVKATKPSGLGFVVNAVADGSVVTLSNTETMTNENGRFPAELSITQGSTVIGTSNFIFNIERSPHPEGTIDGDAESLLPELTLLVERIEAAADSVDEDTQAVTEAKAEVLQAKADTLQAKADTLTARDDALQAKADAITAKESAEASAQAAAEASERAEQLIGSVSTKADAIVKSSSGEIASFSDGGDDLPMKSLKVNIVPKQSGSGDPSPSNVRPISGYDTVNIHVSPTTTAGDGNTYPISLGQTVYGGTLDVVSGKLTITRVGITLNSLDLIRQSGGYYQATPTLPLKQYGTVQGQKEAISSCFTRVSGAIIYDEPDTDNAFTVGSLYLNQNQINIRANAYANATELKNALGNEVIVYELATPIEIQLTPTEIKTLLGNNNIWSDSGTVEVEYRADTTLAYNELVAMILENIGN